MATDDEPASLPWDDAFAATLIGKYILVGLAHFDAAGVEQRHEQLHGVVEKASRRDGIVIALRGAHDGRTWAMPPLLSAIRPANPGTYTLREAGDVIENPDFLCTIRVDAPPH